MFQLEPWSHLLMLNGGKARKKMDLGKLSADCSLGISGLFVSPFPDPAVPAECFI